MKELPLTQIAKVIFYLPMLFLLTMVGLISIAFLLKTRFQTTSNFRLSIFTLVFFIGICVPPPIIILWLEETMLCLGGVLGMLWLVIPFSILYFDTMRFIRQKKID